LKKIILMSLVVFCLLSFRHSSYADQISYNEILSFAEVVKVQDVKKDNLYLRARNWFLKTYNVGTNVITLQDQANGELVGDAMILHSESEIFNPNMCAAGKIHYTIHIWVKDGRYKYDISNFYLVSKCSNTKWWNIKTFYKSEYDGNIMDKTVKENHDRVRTHILNDINNLISSLKEYMANATNANNDNW